MKEFSIYELFVIGILLISIFLYTYIKVTDSNKVLVLFNKFPNLKKTSKVTPIWIKVIRIVLYVMMLSLFVVALVNPNFNSKPPEETTSIKQGVDIIFLVDVSLSMYAVDTPPNRLTRFKDTVLHLLPALSGNRLGIIAFAGSPFLYCPMTSDLSAFAEYVRGMEPDMIPDTGTDIESAFAKASSMLSSNKILRSRLLVFVSDGESMNEKYPSFGNGEFFIWGVGTSSGSSIYYKDDTTGNAGFVTTDGKLVPYEDQGTLVKSILNESYLRKLASKNSGEYINISSSPEKAEKIISKISSMEKNSNKVLQSMSRKDSYIYFLFPAFILMLLDITLLEWLAQRYTNPKSI